jgi:cell division ATPase FtsA
VYDQFARPASSISKTGAVTNFSYVKLAAAGVVLHESERELGWACVADDG